MRLAGLAPVGPPGWLSRSGPGRVTWWVGAEVSRGRVWPAAALVTGFRVVGCYLSNSL